MSQLVADYLLDRLKSWGVQPHLRLSRRRHQRDPRRARPRRRSEFEFIQARHEEMAAFMACAHAKFTGEVGVCLATSGPGAIHLLNGLYDAKLDHQPVVAIVGQQARLGAGRQLPAGGRPAGRCSRTSAHEYVHMATRAGADPPPGRPRGADRAGRAHRRPA